MDIKKIIRSFFGLNKVSHDEEVFIQEEKEHQLINLAALEYKIIPQHCFVMCSRRPDKDPWIDSIELLKDRAYLLSETDKQALDVKSYEDDNVKWVFYQFPQPQRSKMAYYGMMIRRTGGSKTYYTLDRGADDHELFFSKCDDIGRTVLCSYKGELTPDAFINFVLAY
jgi:hypothetical protein